MFIFRSFKSFKSPKSYLFWRLKWRRDEITYDRILRWNLATISFDLCLYPKYIVHIALQNCIKFVRAKTIHVNSMDWKLLFVWKLPRFFARLFAANSKQGNCLSSKWIDWSEINTLLIFVLQYANDGGLNSILMKYYRLIPF